MGARIRAKFVCNQREQLGDGSRNFTFDAVVSSDENSENAQFWKYTPAGSLSLSCMNDRVDFEEGKEYYLDITPAAE